MGVTDRLTCGIHGRVTGICHLCADERHNRDLTAALAAKERAEAMTHEHRSEFLGEIQRRVIELGGDPPYWPARNDIEAHDDVESAARMILELLQERDALAAKLAEAERTNVALAALVSAAKEDAGRYRWLRGDGGPSSLRWPRWCVQHWTGHWNPVSEFEMDEAIDAAISQERSDEH